MNNRRGNGTRRARYLAVGPIGALLGAGLSVVPTTVVQAQVVQRTRAAEVAGPLAGSEVRSLPFPALHVAVHWEGNPGAEVTVAFGSGGTSFGAPFTVEHDEVGMQRRNGETYGTVLPASGATAARVTSDRPIGRLTVLALAEETVTTKAPVPKSQAGAQTAPAGIVGRDGWKADESLRFDRRGKEIWPPVFQTVQKLVVHHTAGANGESGEAAKATLRSTYYYHAVTQGWGDIGYNYLIDAAGVVYKGRVSHAPGSAVDILSGENSSGQGVTAGHAFGYNSGTVGIAMLGSYSTPEQQVPDATKAALKNLLVAKAGAHGLDTARIAQYTSPLNGTQAWFENVPGHREVPDNATDCPGGHFQDTVLRFLRSEMQGLTPPADTTAPLPTGTVSAVLSKRAAVVSWPASTGDNGTSGGASSGIAGYDVWRSAGGGAPVRIGGTTGRTFTDSARANGAAYQYSVTVYDGAGNRSAPALAPKAV
jgi:hypothetical protein